MVLGNADAKTVGLLVRKPATLAKLNIPLIWGKDIELRSIRSTATPNFKECDPCVRKASSYPWNEFQYQKFGEPPPKPPRNCVTPPINTLAAYLPGEAARDGSASRGVIADTVLEFVAPSRLKPPRAVLIKVGLKLCVSSSTTICRFVC